MKIKCEYCGAMFNDTLEHCPSCGAANPGVVRKSGDQPITIEELKKWYESKGLPPYEVTRFFIGENHTGPRAFGIYQDKKTKNFVVYKNKDNGQRAIRYEGTDEAYAVNELFMRLKQEIIEQKKHNLLKKSNVKKNSDSSNKKGGRRSPLERAIRVILGFFGLTVVAPFLLLLIIGFYLEAVTPEEGYYSYENKTYYAMDSNGSISDHTVNHVYWFSYDRASKEWDGVLIKEDVPKKLIRKRTAKKFYISDTWSGYVGATDITKSLVYSDVINNYEVATGYYDYGGNTYYHLYDEAYLGWYYYDYDDGDWYETNDEDIPEDLVHNDSAQDFYFTPTWDASTQITDFEDTAIYEDYLESQESSSWDNDDSDYSWDSGDSWDSDSSDWDSDW